MGKNGRYPEGSVCPDCHRDVSGKAKEPGDRCNKCYNIYRKSPAYVRVSPYAAKAKHKDTGVMTPEELDAFVESRYATMPDETKDLDQRRPEPEAPRIRIFPDTRSRRR